MAKETKTEWAEATWNPVVGCTKVSPGCDNCYAESLTNRLRGPAFPSGFAPTLKPHKLGEPLGRRNERVTFFVNSLSDLFHRDFDFTYIGKVFGVMAAAGRLGHTFQVLTKRPERMRAFFESLIFAGDPARSFARMAYDELLEQGKKSQAAVVESFLEQWATTWPLPHVWLGVSIENERVAKSRLDALRACPAAVRFVSAEPLLGSLGNVDFTGIDWVIVGGESGSGARPMEVTWALETIAAARAAGAAVFVKQLGEHWAKARGAKHRKGGDPEEWPADLRIREMPRG